MGSDHADDHAEARVAASERPLEAEPPAERRSFEAFVGAGDPLDVLQGAALIAKDAYPEVRVDATVDRLRELAKPLDAAALRQASLVDQVAKLREHVFDRLGFVGNTASYYDPDNSYINRVLERRLGIPLTLALVFCEIAKLVGVNARGISFPGHFLVRIDAPRTDTTDTRVRFIDPFFSGRELDEEGLESLLARVVGGPAPVHGEYLAPASSRAVLYRMLVNLRGIYLSRGEQAKALVVVDRMLVLAPDNLDPLRDRGLLWLTLGASEAGQADLERYLRLAPNADDADAIRERLGALVTSGKTWS